MCLCDNTLIFKPFIMSHPDKTSTYTNLKNAVLSRYEKPSFHNT